MIRSAPVRLTAALAGIAVTLVATAGITTASAHEGEGVLVVESQGPASGTSVPYQVRLTWVNDGHPAAADTTITATAVAPDGTPQTPVPMVADDDDGRFSATLDLPAPGAWTVRFTSVTPAATLEVVETIVQPTTTTEPSTTTTTAEAATPTTEQASQVDDGDDADGIGLAGLLAALLLGLVVVGGVLGFVRSARRTKADP